MGVILPNCIEFVEIRFALYKNSMIFVPLNMGVFDVKNLIDLIIDSDSEILILDEKFIKLIDEFKKNLPKIKKFLVKTDKKSRNYTRYKDFLEQNNNKELEVNINEKDITMMGYSSGTTGKPKGIVSTQKNWICSMNNLHKNADTEITEKDVMMHITPLTHATSIFLLPYFLKGASQILVEDYDPKYILKTIKKEKVTSIFLIPAMLLGLLKETYKLWFLCSNFLNLGKNLSSLKTIIYGSAPMYLEHLKKCIKRFGNILEQGYGMAEVLPPLANLKKKEHVLDNNKENEKKLLSTGKIISGVELKIIDKNEKEVKSNIIGEIIVKSDTVTKGYLKNPKATKKSYRNGWFYTNDLGYFDEQDYLYIVGRKKDMIIKRGMNIFPKKIEEILLNHPKIKECCVFGIPDIRFGEEICAAIVKKSKLNENEILSFCRSKLNPLLIPKKIEFYDKLPKNASGKIMRNQLKEKFWKGYNFVTN